mmetsp:Transcript_149899/g.481609  ORF Transcript_149899/g.481609 Transcript_149899/m.481609 type:complete len:365 (+) Transcript_149899:1051-2145(+)
MPASYGAYAGNPYRPRSAGPSKRVADPTAPFRAAGVAGRPVAAVWRGCAGAAAAPSSTTATSSSSSSGGGGGGAGARVRRRLHEGMSVVAASVAPHEALPLEFEGSLEALQGEWGDDIGSKIEISGAEARFSDGSGPWRFEDDGGSLALRGARLVGSATAPVWKFPTGVERRWARAAPPGTGDRSWAATFLKYKEDRLQLRRDLKAAFDAQDFEGVVSLKSAWEDGSTLSGPAPPQRALVDGRALVSGTCFRHRKFGYRAVLVASEPWCSAPADWRARTGVPQLPRGEAQPFHHCLVDDRDRPGGQITFVAEENVEPCSLVYPIESSLVDFLVERCDVLGCYIPSQMLEAVLERQRSSGKGFSL